MTDMTMTRGGRWGLGLRVAGWSGVAGLIALPWVAMRFTDEVAWTAGDFAIAAMMLVGAGATLEIAVRMSGKLTYRAGAVLGILASVLLFWVTGAVGIIGSENEPANLLYFSVLALSVGGAFISRLEARGMARAMLAAAVLQALIGALAVASGWGESGRMWPRDVIVCTALFTGLWLASAGLFGRAAGQRPSSAA